MEPHDTFGPRLRPHFERPLLSLAFGVFHAHFTPLSTTSPLLSLSVLLPPRSSLPPYSGSTRHPDVPRRLLLTALMIGAKFLDDRFLSNRFYAEVGGVTLQELNAMEVAMLKRLGWRATVR